MKHFFEMPRFRGSSYEVKGGWEWEVCVSNFGSDENSFWFKSNEIFINKLSAIENMKKAIKEACDLLQKEISGNVTGDYIDLNANEMRNWNTPKDN